MADHVLNHCAPDAPLVTEHPTGSPMRLTARSRIPCACRMARRSNGPTWPASVDVAPYRSRGRRSRRYKPQRSTWRSSQPQTSRPHDDLNAHQRSESPIDDGEEMTPNVADNHPKSQRAS